MFIVQVRGIELFGRFDEEQSWSCQVGVVAAFLYGALVALCKCIRSDIKVLGYSCVILMPLAGCSGSRIVSEVDALEGCAFVVLAEKMSDGITIPLYLELRDVNGAVLHRFGVIDSVVPSKLADGSLRFAVFRDEAIGIATFYESGRPDYVLGFVDFSERIFFPPIGSVGDEESSGVLEYLREKLGNRDLRLRKAQ